MILSRNSQPFADVFQKKCFKYFAIFTGAFMSIFYRTPPMAASVLFKPDFSILINLLHAISLFLYPLKTSENQRFSDVSKGYRKRYCHEPG